MKCLICDVQIDESKEFPPIHGPQGQVIDDVLGRWKHAEALRSWIHVSLTAQTGGGSMSILSGHVCPLHCVAPGSLALAVTMPPTKNG